MSSSTKTFCRNCSGFCGLSITVDEGRITEVRPDREHPATRGYHCIKASMSIDISNGGEGRIVNSLRRTADGGFETIASDAAADEIGQKLRAIVDRYGPRSVAMYSGTGHYQNSLGYPLAKSMMHELGSPNWFSSMTIDQSAIWVTMLRMGFMASGKPLPETVDTLMIVGNNPLVSHYIPIYNPAKTLREMRQRGAKIIVVDPRRTETARFADIHLQLRPGEDATLFAAIVRHILDNDWHNERFCSKFVAGLDDLRAAVDPFTIDYAAQRCGVPGDDIAAAAAAFAQSPKSLAVTGTGPCMGPHSNLAHHMVETLNALRGSYNLAGDILPTPGIFLRRQAQERVIGPRRSWKQEPKCHSSDTGQIFGEFPTAALPDEILTPGENKIRALIVWSGNPIKALGQPEKTLRAFDDLDLLVTIDPRMTDTAKRADYILAPTLQYERHDVNAIADVMGHGLPFVQYATPVVKAPAGTIDEVEIFWRFARQLGIQLEFRKIVVAMSYEHAAPGLRIDMETIPDQADLARQWCDGGKIDFDTLRANPGGVLLDVRGDEVLPAEDGGERLDLCPDDIAAELADVARETDGTAFPYRLAVRRLLETMNSAFQSAETTRRRHPTNFALMNPTDLAKEGLTDGGRVTIESVNGRLSGVVRSDKDIRCGTISMSHMWGELEDDAAISAAKGGGFTGHLVSLERDLDPINLMPLQTGIPVRIVC